MTTKRYGEIIELKNVNHTFGEADVNFGIMTVENEPLLLTFSELEKIKQRGQRNHADFQSIKFEGDSVRLFAMQAEIKQLQREKSAAINDKLQIQKKYSEQLQTERGIKVLLIIIFLFFLASIYLCLR